jgi:Xaa-Pro aminopeptidase
LTESDVGTWDDEQLKRDRIALLQKEMARRGIGALFLNEGVHQRYALNMEVPGGKVLVPVEGDPVVFVRPRDEAYVRARHATVRPRLGTDQAGVSAAEAGRSALATGLAAFLRDSGLEGEPVAIDTLGVKDLLDLVGLEVDAVDAEPVIERAWTVKTPDEVAIYRTIGQQYASALGAFRDAISPGVTEKELASVATFSWLQAGGEDMAQLNVCSAENMNPWRRWPTERKLEPGDLVGIDLHGRGPRGLRGDASTTFFVGDRAPSDVADLYRRAYEYLQGAIAVFRAGRSIAEATALVPAVPDPYRAQQNNYNVAHGIGMGPSGYPQLDPKRKPIDDVLQANQVLSVECYFGEVGSPRAVKLEEQIVVRDGEPEILGPLPVEDRFLN